MPYTLITGATGLLGGYLLRDCLRRDWPVAVVTRRTSTRSAKQRIEGMLAPWEIKKNLPRPVILEGDLSQPDLGLDTGDLKWIGEHVSRVIHSAASISFYRDEASGEPYRSNVEGTRHLLQLCESLGLQELHHISTAYVCGQRSGQILETELDCGQTFGNDYERSKVSSEQLVRASKLASRTIYRPAIIVGDSLTGYTTTFHGFYTPLQVAWWLARSEQAQLAGTWNANDWFLKQIGLQGTERKNLVPVDWVSEAIVRLVMQPETHGRTYHLTQPHPPNVMELAQAMEAVIQPRLATAKRISRGIGVPTGEEEFRQQMAVYRAYFRDDPTFDQSQLQAALPDWPCPRVDRQMLIRLAEFALDTDFGWPRAPLPSIPPELEQFEALFPLQEESGPADWILEITGPGGGAHSWRRNGNSLLRLGKERRASRLGVLRIRGDRWCALLRGERSLQQELSVAAAYVAAEPAAAEAIVRLAEQLLRDYSGRNKIRTDAPGDLASLHG